MRSNDRLRALWRSVDQPAGTRGDLEALASRISLDASLALRARVGWTRAAVSIGMASVAIMVLAMSVIPRRPSTTLLGAISGGEVPQRTFEIAMVGPRDGAWMIAAAIGKDR